MADNNIENEPGQPAQQGQQTHEGQQAQDHGGNPWGADFDAQRAWNKQQALIEENKRLKERPVLTDEQKQQLQRLQELEEASRTDAERQAEKIASLTEAAGQVPTLQTENLRLRVALEKELPANLATRLQGGTREELEADADALKGLIGQASSPQQSQPGMRPNPAQGTSGGGTGPSIEDLVTEARKTGNTREAVRLESMKLLNLPTP